MVTREERKMQWIATIVCGLFSLLALLPFLLLVIGSFTDNSWAIENGFSFFPKKVSLESYEYIAMQWDTIGRAYLMTILSTVVGTVLCLFITTTFAYAITKTEYVEMKILSFMLIFTMLFSGGIVSSYYCYIKFFHIRDTLAALIVPNLLLNAFNVILVRNYFNNSIPAGLMESARIDGASEYKIFFSIILPLSKPIIATIGMMSALAYWNDWVNGLYYLTDRGGSHLYTIQLVLNKINDNIQMLKQNSAQIVQMGGVVPDFPGTTIRMAIAVVGILPLLVAYPFFQKYFVKGITLGAVKE